MNVDDVAARLGVPAREIASITDTPAGVVVVGVDGSQLIIVPADRPDAEGKTGVMFFALPHDKYRGTFPVYAQPLEDDEPDGDTEVAEAPKRRGRPPKAKE